MNGTSFIDDNYFDPALRTWMRNACRLRSYQTEALRKIYDGALRHRGERFTVTFPRQSGKNETQAHLESALMAANLWRGGSIIKILPTEKNQGVVSRLRLEGVLRGAEPMGSKIRSAQDRTVYGNTQVRYLSASPNSAIVGATADLLLEVDEAQLVRPEKFDRDAAPMAASANAALVFWGTVWDDQTLLSRETRLACRAEEAGSGKRLFLTDAAAVGKEVPEYADFVRGQIESLGREHPTVRTQFFCEEISDLTSMFTPDRLIMMRGDHDPLSDPEPERTYVFLIDIAGSDERSTKSRISEGFSDRRDATVLTICDVALPDDANGHPDEERGPVWRVAARRYYRNMPAELLEREMVREVERWDPVRITLDHTGLGCMLSDFLCRKYPYICRAYDITAAAKTEMAWRFISKVNTHRWQEYRVDESKALPEPAFDPKRDRCEILDDPALLQRMFFRELRNCRLEPTAGGNIVRWGVPDGTRDPGTGRFIHDDLVMSAALCAFEEDDIPLNRNTGPWDLSQCGIANPYPFDPDGSKWVRETLEYRKEEERTGRQMQRE